MSQALEQAIKELVSSRSGKPSSASALDYSKADSVKSFCKQMESTGTFITILWDYIKNDFYYLSDKFFDYFGFDPGNVYKEKLAYPLNRLIPIDAIIMMNGSKYVWDYVSGLPFDQRKNYKVIAEFRMKNDNNKMIRVLYQNIAVEMTDTGGFWLNMMLFELSPEQDMETLGTISCIDAVSGETILTAEKVKENLLGNLLSDREIAVLRSISKGKGSGQIAAELNISEKRVDTYRGEIVKKLKAADSKDAVSLIRDMFSDIDRVEGNVVHRKYQTPLRERIVELMKRTVHYWEESTGLSKADLAEHSRIWGVYPDGNGWRRTQTLDKYLNISTLPKKPRISQVLQSAYFVLSKCETTSSQREQLEAALECVREKRAC